MKKMFAVFAAQLFLGAGWAMAESEPSMEVLRGCAAEGDASRRLTCYDSAMGRQQQESSTPSAAAVAPKAAAPIKDESRFGYRGSIAREEMDRRKAQGLEQLSAVVTEVQTRPYGQYVVTLDNGQVWEQLAPNGRIRIKVGDNVTIKSASMGSFTLVTQSGLGTKVSRTR